MINAIAYNIKYNFTYNNKYKQIVLFSHFNYFPQFPGMRKTCPNCNPANRTIG